MIKNGPEPLYFTNSAAEIHAVPSLESGLSEQSRVFFHESVRFILIVVGITLSWKSHLFSLSAPSVLVSKLLIAPIGTARTAAVA